MAVLRRLLLLPLATIEAQPLAPSRLRAGGSDLRLRQAHASYAVSSAAPLFEWAPQHGGAAAPERPAAGDTNVLWRAAVQMADVAAAADLLRQTAFELRVSDAVTREAAWSSGRVRSSQPSARYPADAARLRGGREYEWSVRWFDGAGAASPWSAAATFRTPLAPAQWDGVAWVGSHDHNLYRSEFDVPAWGVKAATLFICGLGWSQPLLNGQAPTDAVLTTAPWRNNERSNGYSSIDVLHTLLPGRNALGVSLGHGWRVLQRDPLEIDAAPRSANASNHSLGCVSWRQTANCSSSGARQPQYDQPCSKLMATGQSGFCECAGSVRRGAVGCNGAERFTCANVCADRLTEASGDAVTRVLRAQLVLTVAVNSTVHTTMVVTKTGDDSWTATAGPVVADHIYNGEQYDARLEQPGWTTAAFNPPAAAAAWVAAAVLPSAAAPRGEMVAWSAPPITISRVTPPVKIWRNAPPAVVTCGHVPERVPLVLRCPPQEVVAGVQFASYGTPSGHCGAPGANASSGECTGTSCLFTKGHCDAARSMAVVSAACVGKATCSVTADCHGNTSSNCIIFGGDPCWHTHKSLAVQVHCAPAPTPLPPPVVHTVDFGANLAGVCRLKGIRGRAGSRVSIRHGEALQHGHLPGLDFPDRTHIYTDNLRSALATDTYIFKGASEGEMWQPTMTYHGFRYVEVTGLETLTAENIEQLHFHSAVAQRTNVTFASPTLNRLQTMALGAQRSNMMSNPSDCPQRDERLGWTGDIDLSSDSLAVNYDAGAFLRFFASNMAFSEDGDGSVPEVVPDVRYTHRRPGDPSWSTAIVQLPFVLWKTYSDTATASTYLDDMVRQVDSLAQKFSGGLRKCAPCESAADGCEHGDWCPPPLALGMPSPNSCGGPTPTLCYTSTFAYLSSVQQLHSMAMALGNTSLAARMGSLGASLRGDFTATWFNRTSGAYDTGSQTDEALAIAALGAVAAAHGGGGGGGARRTAHGGAKLLEAVLAARHHPTTGIIGTKFLHAALASAGHHTDALALLEQTSYPSFGFEFANSAEPASENLWELMDSPWEGTGMNSRNHHMFSSFSHYLVTTVGGVEEEQRQAAATTGDSDGGGGGGLHLHLRPAAGGALDVAAARVRIDTARGLVEHAWRREGGAQCGKAAAGDEVQLDCGASGGVIEAVRFASFGTPGGGGCRSVTSPFTASGSCHAPASEAIVRQRCLGRRACVLSSTAAQFAFDHDHEDGGGGGDGSGGQRCEAADEEPMALWVDVQCSHPHSLHVQATVPIGVSASLYLPVRSLEMVRPQLLEAVAAATAAQDQTVARVTITEAEAEEGSGGGGGGGDDVLVAQLRSGTHQLTLRDSDDSDLLAKQ
jgi:hypothetical protein